MTIFCAVPFKLHREPWFKVFSGPLINGIFALEGGTNLSHNPPPCALSERLATPFKILDLPLSEVKNVKHMIESFGFFQDASDKWDTMGVAWYPHKLSYPAFCPPYCPIEQRDSLSWGTTHALPIIRNILWNHQRFSNLCSVPRLNLRTLLSSWTLYYNYVKLYPEGLYVASCDIFVHTSPLYLLVPTYSYMSQISSSRWLYSVQV